MDINLVNTEDLTLKSVSTQAGDLEERMLRECVVMADYARSQGIAVNSATHVSLMQAFSLHGTNEGIDTENLNRDHNTLAELIRPATPGSIMYLNAQKERQRYFKFLGPIPTIRNMVIVTILSLICFLVLASLGDINQTAMAQSFFDREGVHELSISSFLLASAAIGASFANLYKAYRYVINGSYDPKYDATYWIRFVLGLIAGYILAEILTLDVGNAFQKPLLALLGGFSASAVFRILNKMIEAVESVFRGDADAQIARREAEIKSRLERQSALERVELAKELMQARDRLKEGDNSAAVEPELDRLIRKIIG